MLTAVSNGTTCHFRHSVSQALLAINTNNGVDLGGRRILVREDREDRDVKQQTGEEGIPRPPRPARATGGRGRGRGAADGEGAAPGRGRGRGRAERTGESSGLQVSSCGGC